MKHLTLTLTGLSAMLANATASAHIGEHNDRGLFSGLTHLLTEHALPITAIALVAGVLILKRLLRA